MRAPCKIDGCERTSAGRGWCKMHWSRWRKHGDPLFVPVSGIDWNVKATCSVPDCGRPNHAHLFCTMHLARYEKHGDPTVVGERLGRPLKGTQPTYAAIHKRVSRAKGPAQDHSCVDCGKTATSWSYVGGCRNELREIVQGHELAYSQNMALYEPRCTSCHRKFDGAGDRPRNDKGQFVPGAEVIVRVVVDDAEAVAA